MKDKPLSWFHCACQRDIIVRSAKTAVIVGTLLMLINYGDKLLLNELIAADWLKIGLTYFVPYAVSTYASVDTVRRQGSVHRESNGSKHDVS